MYKTKAVRKAARWAKRLASTEIIKEYAGALWYNQLIHHHGIAHANVMVADAKTVPSFIGVWYRGSCGGVVLHTQTKYKEYWRAAAGVYW